MIDLKSEAEIKIMRQGGKILTEVFRILFAHTKEGVTLRELDRIAEQEILKRKAFPSFKMVKGYNWSICGCINEVVVHGIPGDYQLKKGDVVGLDCGVFFQGFHTDAAWTVYLEDEKRKKKEIKKFLFTGEKALKLAIEKIKVGNYLYDVSSAIQKTIEKEGYSVVKTLVGHGIGKKLHEEPEIPGFVKEMRLKTPKLSLGMTLAIEVIYNLGTEKVSLQKDGWTITTQDGKISGLFEATVALTPHGCLVLTDLNSNFY